MSEQAVTVRGRITETGELELPRLPRLEPGEVEVMVRPVKPASGQDGESLMDLIERIWAENAASGRVPRTAQEIDESIRKMREEDEEGLAQLERTRRGGR